MTNLVVISNDQRVSTLIDSAQPLVQGKIALAENFDLGMAYVFEKRPVAVYIQDTIDGISCEKIAHHIRSMLQNSAPKLILLYDSAAGAVSGSVNFDDRIDLAMADPERTSCFLGTIKGSSAETTDRPPSGAPAAAMSRPAPPPADLPKVTEPAFTETVPTSTDSESKIHPHYYLVGMVEGTAALKHPIAVRNISRYTVGLALMIVVGAAVYYLLHFTPWNTQSVSRWEHNPTPKGKASRRPSLNVQRLPSPVQHAQPDPAFAATAPGWERYLSETREFRVFREHGSIKAIQVIARKGSALTDSFFKEFMHEICNENTWGNSSRRKENGYELESGTLSCGMEFTIYRKHASAAMVAFVISLP
jgi:hypothetical protein